MRHRTLPNGDIVFPNRGDPPNSVPGYEQDDGDPYVFHPAFIPCKHRNMETFSKPCGRLACRWLCRLLKHEVHALFCDNCKVEPKQ